MSTPGGDLPGEGRGEAVRAGRARSGTRALRSGGAPRWGRCVIGRSWVAVAVAVFLPVPAAAHPVLMTYIHRQFQITVDPVNIDVRVDLTFHEIRSLAERRRMDADHDGRITPAEIRRYLDALADELATGLDLTIDGQPITAMLLYDPEIDLLGVDGIAPSHHHLRLHYFARTPAWLRPGHEIRLYPELWPRAPSLTFAHAEGRQGVRVEVEPIRDPLRPVPAEQGEDVLRIACLAVPAAGPGDDGVARSPDVQEELAGWTPAQEEGSDDPVVGTAHRDGPVGETPASRRDVDGVTGWRSAVHVWLAVGGLALAGVAVELLRRRVERG